MEKITVEVNIILLTTDNNDQNRKKLEQQTTLPSTTFKEMKSELELMHWDIIGLQELRI